MSEQGEEVCKYCHCPEDEDEGEQRESLVQVAQRGRGGAHPCVYTCMQHAIRACQASTETSSCRQLFNRRT